MIRLKKKSQLHLELYDYLIRAIVKKGASVDEWRVVELPLEPDVIEQMTVVEIDRMMNFFKFSLHKGERAVDEVIVLGDNPIIGKINEILRGNLSVTVICLTDEVIQKKFPQFKAKHAALLGLTLKEGTG